MHSRLGREVEDILAKKGLTPSTDLHEYLAQRAGDRAGALADLRKVTSAAELDALMEKTLGKAEVRTSGNVPQAEGRSAEVRQARAEREAKKKADRAERHRLDREAHPDWPVVGDKPVRPYEATASTYKWKYNDGNFIHASLGSDGTLQVTLKARGTQRAGGESLLKAAINHFGKDRIKQFWAEWVRGSGFEDNYLEYMANLAKNMTREDAARATWTGRKVDALLDFKRVTVPAHGPNPTSVRPTFSK